MTRNDDALAGNQRCALRAFVDLGDRPQRDMIGGRDRLQAIARPGEHRRSAVPELDGRVRRNGITNGDRVARGPRCRQLKHLGHELLLDRIHLLDIDVRNFVMLRKVEARIVAAESRLRLDVAAAEHTLRQEDVDETIDIQRDVVRRVSRIDGDDQMRPDAFALQNLRKDHGTEPAHGVPDQDDRLRVFAILLNRPGRDQAADGEFVDVGGDAGLFKPLGETIHPARENGTERATEQITPRVPGSRR